MKKSYDANSIQILGDIEHIQRRMGMYVGDALDPRQLLSEVFDNAIDEVQAGFSDKLEVIVNTENNLYEVRDYGRGIPHGKKKLDTGEEKDVIEILCTKSNSGGKFNNESYNYSSGLNGLGLTITNALSDKFYIKSYRDGKVVSLEAENGNIISITNSDTNEKNGTLVGFIPSKTIFRSDIIPQKFILNRCNIASALGFKAELIYNEDNIDTNSTMFDLITEEDDNINTYYEFGPIDINMDNGEKMKVALRYTSETNDRYFGFTNLLSNSVGGTHVNELSKAMISSWKEFLESHKKLKPNDVELRNSDYLVGLRGVCAVFISNPEFSSQTKEKLTVPKSYFNDMMSKFKEEFKKILNNNLDIPKSLIKRFEEYRISQNKLLSRKEISSIIKVNNDNPDSIRRRSVVPKLIECTSKNRKNTELFLVEGDSAAGPAARVRDKSTQAVLPLRGKIMNVTNMDPRQAVKSQEVCNIVNSIGCGIGSQCDSSKSRYERVVINGDADPDGAQIVCLVLSVFINMLPDIVKDGRLYIAQPPLYMWYDKKKNIHGTSDRYEVPDDVSFSRLKGLGEFDDEEYYHFCMNPETRNVIQVEYPSDIEKFNYILGTSAGKASLLKDLGIIRNMVD